MVASAVEGKVAEVLNDREVVVNRGRDHGVKLGTRFKIIETVEIHDPDSGDVIGTITREKIRFKVVHIEPSMSVARTYETVNLDGSQPHLGESIQRMFVQAGIRRTDVKRIRQTADSNDPVLVKIGDVVNEVTDDD